MRAMVLHAPRTPLRLEELPDPRAEKPGQGLLKVRACAVCRTDLHILDGELTRPKLPLILGHEIVGTVVEATKTPKQRTRVRGPWLARWGGACRQGRRVFAFTRRGDATGQAFARELGATWAGASDEAPPEPLDAALIFAPVGDLVPRALKAIRKGGAVVCGGIHMSDIPSFPYEFLWGERVVRSVANLAPRDAEELLALAPRAGVRTEVTTYPLPEANEALAALRQGRVRGA